jgi:hypothetical protein
LKENNRRVLGCGVKSSTSDLLIANCDEFLYYDDLIRVAKRSPPRETKSKEGDPKKDKQQEAAERVLEVLHSIEQDFDPLWGSTLKQAIRRVYPGFNEGYYGHSTFSDLLESLEDKGLLVLDYDESKKNYKVSPPRGGGGAAEAKDKPPPKRGR